VAARELELLLRESHVLYTREHESFFRPAQARGAAYRRPDFTVPDHALGVTWAVDVVVTDAQGAGGRTDTPGGAAASAEAGKAASYAEALAATSNTALAAVGLETFGGLGDGARGFLRRVAALSCGDDPHGFAPALAHHFAQRLGVALLREQAQALRRWACFSARLAAPEWDDGDLGADAQRLVLASGQARGRISCADLCRIRLVDVA
jgi:hypothetical protein